MGVCTRLMNMTSLLMCMCMNPVGYTVVFKGIFCTTLHWNGMTQWEWKSMGLIDLLLISVTSVLASRGLASRLHVLSSGAGRAEPTVKGQEVWLYSRGGQTATNVGPHRAVSFYIGLRNQVGWWWLKEAGGSMYSHRFVQFTHDIRPVVSNRGGGICA